MVFSWLHFAIILFLLGGLGFAIGPLMASKLLSHKIKDELLYTSYECGMVPHGDAWGKFGINYYFYALIFLAFDVDVLYLFPVAVFYPQAPGIVPFIDVLIFVGILGAAVVYFLRKGVFTWPRKVHIQ